MPKKDSDEFWDRICQGVAAKAPEAFKDCDLDFTLSVKNADGSEKTIYEHEVSKDDGTNSYN